MENKKPIYFTRKGMSCKCSLPKPPKTKLKKEIKTENNIEINKPMDLIQKLISKQKKFQTSVVPKTTEQASYLQRLQEKAKPPSVKMEEERLRKQAQNIQVENPIDKLIAEMRAEREQKTSPTKDLEDILKNASSVNPLAKNLNLLLDKKKGSSKKNLETIMKLSSPEIDRLIQDAVDKNKDIDQGFLRALYDYSREEMN